MNNRKYPLIRIWGRQMGSYPDYILRQVEQAKIDNAPWDAVYKVFGEDGQWLTIRELTRMEQRIELYRTALEEVYG